MPRIPNEGLIPRADKLLIRAFPKIAHRLAAEPDGLKREEMDAYLKLLPGAVERYQAVSVPKTDVHESIVVAIDRLIETFGSRNALEVEPTTPDGTSNTSAELGETADSVGDTELPEGPGASCNGGAQGPSETKGRPPGSNGGDRRSERL